MDSEIYKTRHIAALLATVLIFATGLGVGYLITQNTAETALEMAKKIRIRSDSIALQNDIAEEHICEINIFNLTQEKAKLGRKVEDLERKLGNNNPNVMDIKERYTLLSIRQLLLVRKHNNKCENGYIPILFFHSNRDNVSASESQGYVLDYIYRQNKDRIINYAFDIDIDTPALNALKSIYEIKTAPSLVVNGTTYKGLKDKQEMEEILRTQTNLY